MKKNLSIDEITQSLVEYLGNCSLREIERMVDIIYPDYLQQFQDFLLKRLGFVMEIVKKSIAFELPAQSYRRVAEDALSDFLEAKINPSKEMFIICGETMGFLYDTADSKWTLFEPSDEPGAWDLRIYEELFKNSRTDKLTLYSVQSLDYVETWKTVGIPSNTFFTTDKSVARHYWHLEKQDVLVEVTLLRNCVLETHVGGWTEYQTIKHISPEEFSMKILEYL